ncbi:hypothetical protein NPIL_236211 [Nephila pilipes]|uniref:Uncharacterized protein n=1 Tax=Nephila pilipes TaxID=299642 RepID=A0A8X6NAX5_NEPPI|nr:hypothetical protein NPIL_236211 [Nephila pilipes]
MACVRDEPAHATAAVTKVGRYRTGCDCGRSMDMSSTCCRQPQVRLPWVQRFTTVVRTPDYRAYSLLCWQRPVCALCLMPRHHQGA